MKQKIIRTSLILIQVVLIFLGAYYFQKVSIAILITYLIFKESVNYYNSQPQYVKKVTYLDGSVKKFTREDWELLRDKIEVMEGVKIKDI